MRLRRPWLWLLLLMLLLPLTFACGDDDDDDNDDQTDDDTADDDTADDDTSDDDDDDAVDEPLATATALADSWIATVNPANMGWSWDSGVLMKGMYELYRLTGEQRYRNYVVTWLDDHIATGYTIAYNDHVPPAWVALNLYNDEGGATYREVVDRARTYIFEQAERLPDGGLNHMGWISGNQIWADTLFMVTPFLNELGVTDNDSADWDEAILQCDVFAAHLRDADTGLYRHMYDADEDIVKPAEKDYWGRGNAWIVAASAIAPGTIPAGHEGRDRVLERFVAQTTAMANLIDEANRWHTIMNRQETYLETSVGPLVAYGIYRAAGEGAPVDDLLPIADRALRGALDQAVVDEQGETLLLGTSYGTGPSSWEMYDYVLKGEQVNYGIGATLLAAVAHERYFAERELPAAQATSETYIHPPTGDDAPAWGYFYLARGDFFSAVPQLEAALAATPGEPSAQMALGLVEGVRFVFGAMAHIDRYMLDEIGLFELIDAILADGRAVAATLGPRMADVEADANFARVVERLVLTEQGGSTAVGTVEVDRGEAYLLDAVASLLLGVADVYDALMPGRVIELSQAATVEQAGAVLAEDQGDEQLGRGLDEIIAAVDNLVTAIETIDAETDDQSDDLIPANLLRLEGEFGIPGVLYPTAVDELITDLLGDFIGNWLLAQDMPQALIDLLGDVKFVLQILRLLVG